jgi:hypothetical protein
MAVLVVAMIGYLAIDQWWPAGHGTLFITSDPPGAQVWLDLKPTNVKTNGHLGLVPTGRHSVMVKLDTLECDPVAQVVEVHKGRIDTARFRLVASRSEERRVGKECRCWCRSRWSPYH